MTKQEYLQQVRKQIHYVFDRNKIEEELEQHLEDSICDLLQDGYTYEEAEYQAVEQMGNPIETGKLLNKEHHPLIGYLCSASTILMWLLLVPFLYIIIFSIGDSIFERIADHTRYKEEQIAILDIDFEIPTHKIHLESIGYSNHGYYYITYHATTKRSYSRAGWSSYHFNVEDYEGNILGGSSASHNFGQITGTKQFDWPEDDTLYLRCPDGTEIILDLKEYCDEKN